MAYNRIVRELNRSQEVPLYKVGLAAKMVCGWRGPDEGAGLLTQVSTSSPCPGQVELSYMPGIRKRLSIAGQIDKLSRELSKVPLTATSWLRAAPRAERPSF